MFSAKILLFMQVFLKVLSGMANRIDPDQTTPKGTVCCGSILLAYAILSEIMVYGSLDLP